MNQNTETPRVKGKSAFQVLVSEKINEMRSNPAVAALEAMRVMYCPGEIVTDIYTLYQGEELSEKLAEAFVNIAAAWEWMASQMNLPVVSVMEARIGAEPPVEEPKDPAVNKQGIENNSPLLEESSAESIDADRLAAELVRLLDKSPETVALAMVKVGEKFQSMAAAAETATETSNAPEGNATLEVVHTSENETTEEG